MGGRLSPPFAAQGVLDRLPEAGKIIATTLDYPMIMDTFGCTPKFLNENPKAAKALASWASAGVPEPGAGVASRRGLLSCWVITEDLSARSVPGAIRPIKTLG